MKPTPMESISSSPMNLMQSKPSLSLEADSLMSLNLWSPLNVQSETTVSNNILCILDEVEQVLDESNLDDPTVFDVEPTPIAPNRAQIVSQVDVAESFDLKEDDMRIILQPLLGKRMFGDHQDDQVSDELLMSKKQRTSKNKVASSSQRPSEHSILCFDKASSTVRGDEDHYRNRFRSYQSEQWSERFQDLLAFKTRHGHCLVPHNLPENPALAQWVKRQRYQHKLLMTGKHSTLTHERKMALEQLGFIWDSHGAAWEERFNELNCFLAKKGHTNVPSTSDNRPLAIWVKCQRRQHKLYSAGEKSNMTQERIDKLESLGFVWNPRRGPGEWA